MQIVNFIHLQCAIREMHLQFTMLLFVNKAYNILYYSILFHNWLRNLSNALQPYLAFYRLMYYNCGHFFSNDDNYQFIIPPK